MFGFSDICLYAKFFVCVLFLNFSNTGKILKYFAGIIMTLLLTHECVVETLDFPETSIDLEVG